jgi:hypothetical protein
VQSTVLFLPVGTALDGRLEMQQGRPEETALLLFLIRFVTKTFPVDEGVPLLDLGVVVDRAFEEKIVVILLF